MSAYFEYFHSYLRYDFIFSGGGIESTSIFKLKEKGIIRAVDGVGKRTSCGQVCKDRNIFPVALIHVRIIEVILI
jgi:hypothetical protein